VSGTGQPPEPPPSRPRFGRFSFATSGELEYERVAFFSDAVFAIAITLLIINIRVPPSVGTGPALARFARGLSQELGRIVSWALSFYVIGRYWIGHHALFRYLERLDHRLISLNLLFLAFVAFLPYATAVVGVWGATAPGVAFYAVGIAAVGFAQGAIWSHARRAGLTSPEVSPQVGRAYMVSLLSTPVVFLASIPLAFLSPLAAEAIWVLIAVTRGLLRRRVDAAFDQTGPASAA
jgi:TMEM175 potassium channel family protein